MHSFQRGIFKGDGHRLCEASGRVQSAVAQLGISARRGHGPGDAEVKSPAKHGKPRATHDFLGQVFLDLDWEMMEMENNQKKS